MEANQGNVISFKMYFLQNDWNDVLASNHGSNESIWLFVKELTNSKAKEYKLKTVKNNSLVLEVPTDEFTIINSLDVAPSGIAVSSSDGAAKVWDTVNGQNKHNLEGHFLDVNKCKFFPSNEVILTAGADMQMKIWSAIDGKCPVTLLGHKGAINDVAIVDRGRNIISVGGDGLVKLWSCAKAQCIENIFDITTQDDHGPNRSINVCKIRSINSTSLDIGVREEPISEGAVGTEDKLPFSGVLVGRQDGTVTFVYDDQKQVIHLTGSDCDPVYDLAYDSKFIYSACRDGKVRKYLLNNAFE
ncbi:PREDICTED: proteasomal ATPase-associated factor 1-like [Rhagoletis zephyria]|uniref:proteasomal ATPase-associated factor 1-like n=1 Tax=Rhagoletis zephyria TaxID=28612 RepID=UPI000811A55A|nr:PREDICTED: proteasomal ATPase-associated factor 1-like [Rhagoletis zephyria]